MDFDAIRNKFTLVTDSAAVMARVAGSLVSRQIAAPDHRWMRCFVYVLNNCMKATIEACKLDSIMDKIVTDFKSMKRIVEDSKRQG